VIDAELRVLHKRGGDEDAVDKIVKAVADENQHAAAAVVVRVGVMVVDLAVLDVAVAPQHQFFQDEENENPAEHGGGDAAHAGGALERMRQQLEKRRAEQGADGVADQHRHPGGARGQHEQPGTADRQHPAEQARRGYPAQGRHRVHNDMRGYPPRGLPTGRIPSCSPKSGAISAILKWPHS